MLYIEEKLKDTTAVSAWHVGEPMPRISGRVVRFDADGEELEVILAAIRSWSKQSK